MFALSVLLSRFVWSLCTNVTTVESWEIDRHETLLRRAKAFGGYLDGPDGTRVRIVKQEFPYDIGIWANISQGMGGGFLTWLWPFSRSPTSDSGLKFEVNGFEGRLREQKPYYTRVNIVQAHLLPGHHQILTVCQDR